MKIYSFLVRLSVLSVFISTICFYLTHAITSNYYVSNGAIFFIQSSVFLLLSTIWVRFIFNQVVKFYVKLGTLIVSFPMLMALSIILWGGSLLLFKASIDDVLVIMFYWGVFGVSLSIFLGMPIYIIVIYLLYKDSQKRAT